MLYLLNQISETSLIELLNKYGFSFVLNIVLAISVLRLYKESRKDRDSYFEKTEKDEKAYQDHIESLWEKRLEETKMIQKIIEDQARSNNELSSSIENIMLAIKKGQNNE